MRVIWKFNISGPDVEFDAPAGAIAIDAQVQAAVPVLWLLCNREAPSAKHRLRLFATGQSIPDDAGDYVASLQMEGGRLILHVFHRQLGVQLAS